MFEERLLLPSPIDRIEPKGINPSGAVFFAKREDRIHPVVSGNKWRKLKYNLKKYRSGGYNEIISFGGAYSNHLYALAYLAHAEKVPLTCIVRGDGYDENNGTLRSLKHWKAALIFVSRSAYREKPDHPDIKKILDAHPHALVIPEGGSSQEAQAGLEELCNEIPWEQFDDVVVSAGTGMTAAVLHQSILQRDINVHLHAVSALKGGFMKKLILDHFGSSDDRLVVHDDYHFGGYGRTSDELKAFRTQFVGATGMDLDLVYNAKAMFALVDLFRRSVISVPERTLYINTGGRRDNTPGRQIA